MTGAGVVLGRKQPLAVAARIPMVFVAIHFGFAHRLLERSGEADPPEGRIAGAFPAPATHRNIMNTIVAALGSLIAAPVPVRKTRRSRKVSTANGRYFNSLITANRSNWATTKTCSRSGVRC